MNKQFYGKKINGAHFPGGKVFGYPSMQCLKAAELFLLEKAQKGLKTARMRSLNVDTASEEVETRYREYTGRLICPCWQRNTS